MLHCNSAFVPLSGMGVRLPGSVWCYRVSTEAAKRNLIYERSM